MNANRPTAAAVFIACVAGAFYASAHGGVGGEVALIVGAIIAFFVAVA